MVQAKFKDTNRGNRYDFERIDIEGNILKCLTCGFELTEEKKKDFQGCPNCNGDNGADKE